MLTRAALATDGREAIGHALDWLSKLRNAILTIAFFAGAAVAAVAYVRSIKGAAAVIVGALSIFCIGAAVGALIFRSVSRSREVPLGYRLKSAKYTLAFKDDPRYQVHNIDLEIEARRSNVTLIEFRNRWTGKGNLRELKARDPGHTVLRNSKLVSDDWFYMYVHLNTPLMKGERTTIHLSQKLFDAGGDFQPFLRKTTLEYTKLLVLSLVFPAGKMPASDQVHAVVRHPAYGDRRVIKRLESDYDSASHTVTLTQHYPAKNRRYCLEWSWDYP